MTGDPARALERLSAVQTNGVLIRAEDMAFAAWVTGLAHLALGEADAALKAVAALEDIPTLELQSRVLGLRLEVHRQLRTDSSVDLEATLRLLGVGRVPPLEALGLHRALGNALEPTEIRNHLDEVEQLTNALAATLPAESREAFLSHQHGLQTERRS